MPQSFFTWCFFWDGGKLQCDLRHNTQGALRTDKQFCEVIACWRFPGGRGWDFKVRSLWAGSCLFISTYLGLCLVLITLPSGMTAVTLSTHSRMVPYRTAFVPEHPVPTIPPMQALYTDENDDANNDNASVPNWCVAVRILYTLPWARIQWKEHAMWL